jgi:hypothetical protein
MPAKIGCDAPKQFLVFVTIDGKGKYFTNLVVELPKLLGNTVG